MPVRRRVVLALSALLLVAGTVGAPTTSAAPRAPRFDVTTNVDTVAGYGGRVFVRFRFQSINPNRQAGFVRLVIPVRTWTKSNQTFSATWGPALQRRNAMKDGYFAVLKGSCAVAKLDGFASSSSIVKQTIDVKFDCREGRSFSIIWYPTGNWWDMDGTYASDEDWTFLVRTRFQRSDPWTVRRRPVVTVAASPVFLDPPSTWLEAPRLITAVEDVPEPPAGEPYLRIEGLLELDYTPAQVEMRLGDPIRSDNGEPVLVLDPDLLAIERTIEVSPCVPGDGYDCGHAPLGVVTIVDPVEGTFGDIAGGVLSSQVSVLAGVTFAKYDTSAFWATRPVCTSYGGNFLVDDGGILDDHWRCAWPWASTPAEAAARQSAMANGIAALSTREHCPTSVTVDRAHVAYEKVLRCLRP